jgi:hypothetical protein
MRGDDAAEFRNPGVIGTRGGVVLAEVDAQPGGGVVGAGDPIEDAWLNDVSAAAERHDVHDGGFGAREHLV